MMLPDLVTKPTHPDCPQRRFTNKIAKSGFIPRTNINMSTDGNSVTVKNKDDLHIPMYLPNVTYI